MADTFASDSDLSTYLGRSLSDSELFSGQQALQLATGVIQSYTRQRLAFVADDTVRLRPRGRTVFLPEQPVVAVSAVSVDGEAVTDFDLDPAGFLWRSAGWSDYVTVSYSHGFQTIPEDVKSVCVQAAARVLSNPTGVRQRGESIGSYSLNETYAETSAGVTGGVTLTPADKVLLARYRVAVMA